MPRRKRKIDLAIERPIGMRVRELRQRMRYEQPELAAALGITRDQLANIEIGRTPLRYAVALKLQATFRAGLEYLAGYSDVIEWPIDYVWPPPEILQKRPDLLFSEAVKECAALDKTQEESGLVGGVPSDIFHRAFFGGGLLSAMEGQLCSIAPDALMDFIGEAINYIGLAESKYPHLPREIADAIRADVTAYKLRKAAEKSPGLGGAGQYPPSVQRQEVPGSPALSGEKELTSESLAVTTLPVQPILPTLLERLRRATATRGRKTELAGWLGVPRQSVNGWLAGAREPSGETTLRLLAWVTAEEAKPAPPQKAEALSKL